MIASLTGSMDRAIRYRIPERSRRWSGPIQSGDRIATASLAIQLVATLFVVSRGALYQDDIRAIIFISGLPFDDSLLWTNATHVVPGTHAVLWLHGRFFGLAYEPALFVIPMLHFGASLATWRMLRRLIDAQWTTGLVFAFSALTPMALSATAWYAQALTLLPAQLAAALAVSALLNYHSTRLTRHIIGVAASVALGLCFAEKSAALFVFLPVVYVLLVARVDSWRGAVAAIFDSIRVWLGLLTVGLVWLFTYTSSGGMDGQPVTWVQAARIAIDHFWQGFLPTLVGGPWTWRIGARFYEDSPYYGVANPSLVASILGALVFAAALALAIRHASRETGRAVLVVLSYYVPCYVLIALARGHNLAQQLGLDLRFWADTVPAVAIGAAMVVAALREKLTWRMSPKAIAATTATAVLWLVGTLVTVGAFSHHWHQNPNERFIDHIENDLNRLDRSAGIFESEVPRRFISSQFGAEASTAFLVPWMDPTKTVGTLHANMVMVGQDGQLRSARWHTLAPVTAARSRLTPRQHVVGRVPAPLPAQRNQSVRVRLRSSAPSTLGLQIRYDGQWWQVVRQNGTRLQWRFRIPAGQSHFAFKLPRTLPVEGVRFTQHGNAVMDLVGAQVGLPQVTGPHPD